MGEGLSLGKEERNWDAESNCAVSHAEGVRGSGSYCPLVETSGGSGITVCSNPQKLRILPQGGLGCGADSTGRCVPDLKQTYALFGCTVVYSFLFCFVLFY